MRRVYESLSALELNVLVYSRRFVLRFSLAGVAAATLATRSALAQTDKVNGQIAPGLLRRALDALRALRRSAVTFGTCQCLSVRVVSTALQPRIREDIHRRPQALV
jgi:hypothetical protein